MQILFYIIGPFYLILSVWAIRNYNESKKIIPKSPVRAYKWIYKIIASCQNEFQLMVCERLVKLFIKNYKIDPTESKVYQNGLAEAINDKYIELAGGVLITGGEGFVMVEPLK